MSNEQAPGEVLADADLAIESHGDFAVLRLARPEKLNALTYSTKVALAQAIRDLGDGTGPRGLVITGTGRAFCAGQDLNESIVDDESGIESFNDISRALLETNVPTAAAINGIAVGGAAEMLFSVDTRVGSSATQFYFPENTRGLVISNAASLLLFRLLRASDAYRLILDGEALDGQEAHRIGLIDEVTEPEGLLERTIARLDRWTAPGTATMHHLRLLRPSIVDVERAMQAEAIQMRAAVEAGLVKDGVQAFLNR